MTTECYHGNCPFHAIEVPLCTEAHCHFPNDILVWPDGSWGYPDEYSHAERVLGDFMRIITNGVSEEELDRWRTTPPTATSDRLSSRSGGSGRHDRTTCCNKNQNLERNASCPSPRFVWP